MSSDEAFNLVSMACTPSVADLCSDVVCIVGTPVFTSGTQLKPFVRRLDGDTTREAGVVDKAVITNKASQEEWNRNHLILAQFNPEGDVDSEFLFLYKTPCNVVCEQGTMASPLTLSTVRCRSNSGWHSKPPATNHCCGCWR